MQFESAIKRNFVLNLLLAFVPDLILAGIVTAIFNQGLIAFFLVVLAIELLPLPIWLMRSIFGWVFFALIDRKKMASAFLYQLSRNKLPEPEDLEKSAEYYFQRIAEDKSAPIDHRLVAIMEQTAFDVLRSTGQLQQLVKISLAYETAIENYGRQFLHGNGRQT